MPDYTVHRYDTDTSGRPIYMTAYQHDWLTGVIADLGFTPTIVQGAFMSRVPGGGAAASAGYHDLAGCLDFRIWDLTDTQQRQLVRTLRRHGAAAWIRDADHGGMEPHCHIVLGTDRPLADGAAWQWQQYLAGRDGLSAGGRDYQWRPDPIVTTPPQEDDMNPAQEAQLALVPQIADDVKQLTKDVAHISKRVDVTAGKAKARLQRLIAQGKATKAELEQLAADLGDDGA